MLLARFVPRTRLEWYTATASVRRRPNIGHLWENHGNGQVEGSEAGSTLSSTPSFDSNYQLLGNLNPVFWNMRFTKPSWVAHHDNHDPHKRMSIFSISVHPDGSRVATGGLDAKIRIWSTSPILSQNAEEKGQHKSLSTLTMHTGPVLVVRWAASGKWLASGSDDTIVMIWDLDPNGGGKVWGSEDVNVEGWKALRRLTGHESDVVDCAWSPADRYLASVGLDSKVFIWCGYTLECIRRLDGHQGFVKGVCWDPVGEYLATQSDDKTVKIWRSTDWRLETTVSKPYETSPGSAFFNRLSWSPDAAYLCTSNAMNNNAVFVAAVVERDTWSSSVSLVGHENTIQVASYNPRLFRRDPTMPLPSISPTKRSTTNYNESPSKRSLVNGSVDGDEDAAEEAANVYSVVALGADDRSISIWRTTDTRPLVVAKEAFDRQILDLSWSADGRSVWACSSDGSIAVLDFSDPEPDGMMGRRRKGEMDGLTTAEETKAYLSLFDFPWPPPLEANNMYMHNTNGYQQNARPHYQMDSYAPEPHHNRAMPSSSYNAPTPSPYSQGGSGMPPLARPSYNTPSQSSMSASGGVPPPPINQAQKVTLTKSGKKRIQPTFLGGGAGIVTSSGAMPPPPSSNAGPGGGMEWAPDGGPGSSSRHGHSQPGTSRQHASNNTDRYPGEYGYQLPTGSRVPGSGEARILAAQPNVVSPRRHSTSGGFGTTGHIPGLDLPPLRTHVSVGLPGDLVFEARNSDDLSVPTEVVCAHGSMVLWTDYVPARVMAVVKTPLFYAASLDDSTVVVYTPAGRRAMPTISLDAPIAVMAASSRFLLAICSNGAFHTWNIQTKSTVSGPSSIASQVSGATGGITHAKVYDNGACLITFTSGTSIAWDHSLGAWVRLAEQWWQQPLQSQSHRSSRPSDPSHSPHRSSAVEETPLSTALALGSLETRLHAARLLGSPADYRAALMMYAARLADDSLADRADELVRELCGPVFWDPSRLDPTPPAKWESKVLGMNKRDLLQELLPILARGRSLSKMAQDWQVLLARIESERDM